jgi:hypothetical protein
MFRYTEAILRFVNLIVSQLIETFPAFVKLEPKISVPRLKQSSTGPYAYSIE